MCGEKATRPATKTWDIGSPPHVRGKEKSAHHGAERTRITPACAGKSNNGTTNKRKNDSVGDLLKVNGQMLKILDALGLDPEADEAAPIDDEM